MPAKPLILILGGTTEARTLAERLAMIGGLRVMTALAGRTRAPAHPAGDVRHGGFGGAEGLATFLRDEGIAAVIDATHPFATRIAANACRACHDANVPRLILTRPDWQAQPGDRWHWVNDAAQAARLLPSLGRRALLTIGGGQVAAFANIAGVHLVVRAVDPPPDLPAGADLILDRGPYGLAAEAQLLATYGIDVMVSKASGGTAVAAKLAAARGAGLPVILLRRPCPPPGDQAVDVNAAVIWLQATLKAMAP